jgi:hypothetical protein
MSGRRKTIFAAAAAAAVAIAAVPAGDYYYRSSAGEGCARCHEIRPNFEKWQRSSHRKVACLDCHSSSLGTNLRRVVHHARGEVPEQIRLALDDVLRMAERCRSCHQQEFAQWKSGPHSTTYARLFTDPKHNAKRRLMDDCLRCHGMHFQGGIQNVVGPISTTGPWQLTDPKLINAAAIPCLSCHSMHREGEPLWKGDARIGAKQEIFRPSLTMMDRRSQLPISLVNLQAPAMKEGERPVQMSPDRRQSLCYQCHAATASRQVGSGDDRTPVGVHEGLSCLACHQKHGMTTRASCADCHPRLSNCGLDVEKMDTTFLSPASRYDIHFVKCSDCHPKGVPPKRSRR